MTVITQPGTWYDHDTPSWKDLKTNVFEPIDFLMHRPMTYVTRVAAQSIANATIVKVIWDQIITTHETWSETVNPTRITPQVAGRYKVLFGWGWGATGASSGQRQGILYKNNSPVTQVGKRGTAFGTDQSLQGYKEYVWCNGTTDYIELALLHQVGSAVNTHTSQEMRCRLYMRWDSAQ